MTSVCKVLTLNSLDKVGRNISVARAHAIKALHEIIFEHVGDRQNRKRIRNFSGFELNTESEEYKRKKEYINKNLSTNDLITICNLLDLKYEAHKDEDLKDLILKNLIKGQLLKDSVQVDSDEDDDDDEIENEEALEKGSECESCSSVKSCNNLIYNRFPMNFNDIESTLRYFDGTETYPVEIWVQELEEMSKMMHWDELQKFIFAKRLLKGMARLFILSEIGISSWNKLKTALLNEFKTKVSSADIHRLLTERRIQKNENVVEYFLKMKEIGNRGRVEDNALMQYVIDGIIDLNVNKTILYGAKNLTEFKEKLKLYEIMKEKSTKSEIRRNESKKIETISGEENKQNITRCFNCGVKGHKATQCRAKNRGAKCFKCNSFGHKSYECPSQAKPQNNDRSHSTVNGIDKVSKNTMYKIIKINDVSIHALIDTGSQVNVMTHELYTKLRKPKLDRSDAILSGFGKTNYEAQGKFSCFIDVDNDSFETMMYVVSDNVMSNQVILGNEFLNEVELIINKDGIKINRIEKENEENAKEILRINLIEKEEIDIGRGASEESQEEVKLMIDSYRPEKTKTTNVELKIILKDETPIYYSPRRLPWSERQIVDKQIDEWIRNEIVEPCSSEFASQVVVVRKKCGTPRVCIDYRKINKVVVRDRYPLPLIEDVLDRLQDAKIFTTIDLKNGFFHVGIEEQSRRYTAFVTHRGQFQFLRVPFGLCNSPAIFQRHINCIFRDLINKGIVLTYIDDLIIPAVNEAQAIDRLRIVLNTAKDYGLDINKKKCQFIKSTVEFLGHRIKNGRIFPTTSKIDAVMNFPEPKSKKQVQSFLGLTGYFRKFIPFYAIIARPLSDLLKNDREFKFQESERRALEELKSKLSQKPVLNIYQQGAETELYTDASMHGYGAILMQRSTEDNLFHPVYYHSKKTSDAEKKYSSYELEVLAVIDAIKKLRVYLLGIKFKIITDCSAFERTMNKKDLVHRVARWAMHLSEFTYELEHRSGTRMRHVDALSRFPINTIEMHDTTWIKLKKAQENDQEIKAIKTILKDKPYENYFMKNGILFKNENEQELIVVPRLMQNEIIRNAHEIGHFGLKKTKDCIAREFYIPRVDNKIKQCITCCIPCILANRKAGKQEGQLHPLHKEDTPLHTFHLDHLGPLESTNKNYKHILTVIDSFTKFVWLYPTKSTTANEVVSRLEKQSKIFGSPERIITDRGSAFTSEEFQKYCRDENIKHHMITTGLPRANGQIERMNSIILSVLTKLSLDDVTKWYRHVDKVQQMMNSTFQRSIDATPFELLTGVPMRTKTDIRVKSLIDEEVRQQFKDSRDELRKTAKKQIIKVQAENQRTYNLRRKPPRKYKTGDLVAIRRTQLGPGLKLKPKYLGPYRITKCKANDTYDVEKEGFHEGPLRTSTCAEYLKLWTGSEDDLTSGSDVEQDGRVVGKARDVSTADM